MKSPFYLIALIASFSGPAPAPAADTSNWYPSSIALPNGMSYHCKLTPLPQSLKGIPEGDRVYINHAYAMILRCAQAKTIMVEALKDKSKARAGYSKYYYSTREALEKLRAEPTPKGLETFRNQVVKAIQLQMSFFDKASTLSEKGASWGQIMAVPEGKQASSLLFAAWAQMQSRYPAWDAGTKDSVYHHLCALDLF
ncbi:MAG: hypothetical protein IPM23_16855 [Candidatus Melainabacteria bacterium]|nr:hypothetical protein [Candidatus Melainabacteria bacterium]